MSWMGRKFSCIGECKWVENMCWRICAVGSMEYVQVSTIRKLLFFPLDIYERQTF